MSMLKNENLKQNVKHFSQVNVSLIHLRNPKARLSWEADDYIWYKERMRISYFAFILKLCHEY